MKKIKTKYFASPFIMVGLIVMLLLVISFWMFTFMFPWGEENIVSALGLYLIIPLIFMGCFPIVALIFSCNKGFSVFEISEKGVKRSLFKVFCKTEIQWNEMYEIRCFGMVTKWMFFSKTCLEGLSYNDIVKRKDVLQFEYSLQIVELIRTFTDKEIINLPEDIIKND